jgi:hypothetical protein
MPDEIQAVLMPVGYYTGDDFERARRPVAAERTHWDRWGQQFSAHGD